MWPYNSDDLKVEALIDGAWSEITTVVRENSGIVIPNRGRGDERSRVTSQTCRLTIDNASGNYSNRNPSSPYYGKLGRNTQLRVKVAPVIAGEADQDSATTDLVAPSVDLDGDAGMLICVWMAFDLSNGPFNITVPGSMTAGTEADASVSTSRSGRETLLASGATGTRTATVGATGAVNAVSVAIPGTVVAEEVLQGDAGTGTSVTLTTDAGTQAGWWLLAVHGQDVESGGMTDAPSGAGWLPVADTTSDGSGRMRAWMKQAVGGAEAIEFEAGVAFGNHAHLFVLSGVTGLPGLAAYRFWGEIPQWPLVWDKSGNDVTAPIEASGLLRRLTRPGSPLRSALFRAATSATSKPLLRAYWPLEDGTRAGQFASGIGGSAMTYTGTAPSTAVVDLFYGSAPILQLAADTKLTGSFVGTNTGTIAARMLVDVPSAGVTNGARLLHIDQTGSAVRRWQILYGTTGTLTLQAIGPTGTLLDTSGAIGFTLDGEQAMVGLNLVQDGSDVDWHLFGRLVSANGAVTEVGLSGTFTGLTVGTPGTDVAIGPNLEDLAVGHVMVGDSTSLADSLNEAIVGHIGETAGARLIRLAAESGITLTVVGNPDDTQAMGPQDMATMGTLMLECRDADLGILYERRDAFGLAYRTRASFNNQTVQATLDYNSSNIADIRPQDNEQYLANDITVNWPDGTLGARATLESGPLSIEDPPDGSGEWSMPHTANLETDSQYPNLAGWLLRLGTWDEYRWPLIATELARLDTTTAARVLGLDLGDRLAVQHTLDFLPPEDIEVLLQGYTERIFTSKLGISWNTSPAKPYDVGVLAETSGDTNPLLGRLGWDSCELDAGVDSDDVTWLVNVTPVDTTAASDFPRNQYVDGELITVTACSGASAPQTWTVTRSVNGVVKSHDAGAQITQANPLILAL